MSNYLFISGVNGFNVGERLCYNRSSFLHLPIDTPYVPIFFSSMTSSIFYDLLSLTHAYDFHMLTVFTCFSLPILYDYPVLYKPPCNIFNGSLVFIVNLSHYRLSPLDRLIDNSLLHFFCH